MVTKWRKYKLSQNVPVAALAWRHQAITLTIVDYQELSLVAFSWGQS